MKIVTIGDKIVEKIVESSIGVLFWNQKILGPSQPMEATINVSEDKKKCKVPNIQERKTVFR